MSAASTPACAGRADRPSALDEPGPAPRAPLPGELYRRAGRWWWRVQLPGEDKAKARPLKSEGAKVAADSRQTAESLAFEIWERAIAENAVRQIQQESTEKIERLKAQFLDKVRHFTELVETANARIEAEAAARAEAEAKLAQMQGHDRLGGQGGPGGTSTSAERGPLSPEPAEPDEQAATPSPVSPDSGEGPAPSANANAVAAAAAAPLPLETGICECCGAAGIAGTCLKRIDSGQSLCPRCLAALQADIARTAL